MLSPGVEELELVVAAFDFVVAILVWVDGVEDAVLLLMQSFGPSPPSAPL